MRWQKLKYGMITRWGEYEWQCEMDLIYSALNVDQINEFLVMDTH